MFGTYSGMSYTHPRYRVVGSMPYSRTIYARGFYLDIVDITKSWSTSCIRNTP